jgi:hypothetical protein
MPRFRVRRPSPSVLIAIAAVVIASASSAVAATLISSSSQIEDNVILSRDIHDNTLRGQDVQNGTLGAEELTSGARESLRGPKGVTGAQGPRGLRGRVGPEGSAAISLVSYPSSTVAVGAGGSATGSAACPKGQRPIGGGARNPSGKLVISASYPLTGATRGWAVTALNPDTAAHPVVVEAVCARVSRVG